MKLHVILILLGYIITIIGRCSKTEESKIAFCGIGVGYMLLATIIWIANVLK